MQKKYDLIVFDWEGTLGCDILSKVIMLLLAQDEIVTQDLDFIINALDTGLMQAIPILFPQASPIIQQEILAAINQQILNDKNSGTLLPGAYDIIAQLSSSGYLIAIASNKNKNDLAQVLHASKLDEFIKVTRTSSETMPKPNPLMLQEILDIFAVSPDKTLMIGDAIVDVQMAKSLGVDAIGIDFSRTQAKLLLQEGALRVFSSYNDVAKHLQLPR
jgi:phosphoglycolate phosphatase